MEFLDKFVLPQSSEHIVLLHYMSMLILFLFISFLSLAIGGTALSHFFRKKGIQTGNKYYLQFSNDLINITTINKSSGVILGIIPIIALILIYAQLLHTSTSTTVNYFILTFFYVTFGLIFIYVYRYSNKVRDILFLSSSLNDNNFHNDVNKNAEKQVNDFKAELEKLNYRSSFYGLLLLIVGAYLFAAGFTFAKNPSLWESSGNIFTLLFSANVYLKWLLILTFSFTITGGLILFYFFFWEGGVKNVKDDYLDFVRKIGLKITFYSGLLIPLLLLLIIYGLDSKALSFSVFAFVFITLIMLFVVYHFVYVMLKENSVKYSGWVFILVIFSVISLIIADQNAVNNATKNHSIILAKNFDVYLADLKKTSGLAEISGAEIFTTRCGACHKFDQKVVGPPYKETLPKYEGQTEKLIEFVKNPTKIDPNYPPMPNPGLKPNEVKAVVTYLLEEYKKY